MKVYECMSMYVYLLDTLTYKYNSTTFQEQTINIVDLMEPQYG